MSLKPTIVSMKCSKLIPAGLLCLGLFTTISAQETPAKTPGQQDVPASPAPVPAPSAVAQPAFSESQILEMYGWLVGRQLGLVELGFTKDQVDIVVKGMLAAAAGKEAPGDPEKIVPEVKAFMQKKGDAFLKKVCDQNLDEGKAFFEKLKDNKDVVELPSGLRYEIVQPGTGAFPAPTDAVKVHYTGKLINGTVFDSSVQRGQPVEIELTRVIPGWTEGLQKIGVGGKIRLYIPADLAYGDKGSRGIQPGSTLIFDIELLDTKAAEPTPAPAVAPTPATSEAPKN